MLELKMFITVMIKNPLSLYFNIVFMVSKLYYKKFNSWIGLNHSVITFHTQA